MTDSECLFIDLDSDNSNNQVQQNTNLKIESRFQDTHNLKNFC